MLAEKIVVRTTATLLAGGAILGLLAFATQTPALGIALAILILASPPLLFTLAVGLKISSRSKKSSDAGSTESAREIGRWVLFLGCLFLVALVVLGSDLSKSVMSQVASYWASAVAPLPCWEYTFRQLLAVKPAELVVALTDPQFTPLLDEKRFRELLAWALGAQRQARERVLAQRNTAP